MKILAEVLDALFFLYLLTFVARFTLQAVRAGFNNQLAQLFITVTNPLVIPARRVIPGLRGLDLATLAVALIVAAVNGLLLTLLISGTTPMVMSLSLYAPLRLAAIAVNLFIFAILIRVLISWIAPYQHNPMVTPLISISEVALRPMRRLIPPVSGFDLSPIFVLILLFIFSRYLGAYATVMLSLR